MSFGKRIRYRSIPDLSWDKTLKTQVFHGLLITHLGNKQLNTVLILIPEINSKVILCLEMKIISNPWNDQENYIKSLE